jgi:CPA1 family monovalent cation:H+ antiporter
MRGVVSLAAAISLPETVANGAPFPERNVIIYLTFCVIFTTLVLQGLTLPFLIRRLKLGGAGGVEEEEREGRRKILRAALDYLDHLRDSEKAGPNSPVYAEYAQRYRGRLHLLEAEESENASQKDEDYDYNLYRTLGRQLRDVERRTAVSLRDRGDIDDEVLRRIGRDLDLLDTRYREVP